MSTNTTNIMEQHRAEAIEAVKSALWNDDHDKAAQAAITAGLDGDDVANIEREIAKQRNTVKELEAIDFHALKSEVEALRAPAEEAKREAEAAQAKSRELSGRLARAEQMIDDARNALQSAAMDCAAGRMPIERMPETVKRIVATFEISERCEALKYELTDAQTAVSELRELVEDLAEDHKTADPKEMIDVSKDGTVREIPYKSLLKDKINAARAELKDAENRLEALTAESESKKRALADARASIWQ